MDKVTLGHFKVVELADYIGQVALDRLDEVKTIVSFGGEAVLPPFTTSLTLPQVTILIGTKIHKSD